MMTRTVILFSTIAVALILGAVLSSPIAMVMAEQPAQAPSRTPTDEPTKAPYVFPTPVFIPTPSSSDAGPTVIRPSGAVPTQPAGGPAQPSGERTYTVVSGDSPWIIAQKVYGKNNGPKYQLILRANGLTETSRLQVGQVLKIPPMDANLPAPAEPTSAPPTAAPTAAATARVATPPPTVAVSKKSSGNSDSNGSSSSSRYELALMALNLLSGILLTGSLVFGFLSYTMYQRARRLEKITIMTRRIRAY